MTTMMSKVEVLFFSADPLSALGDGTPRLGLDDEVSEIQKKAGAARHRSALKFDWNPAARSDDLLQALLDKRPQIVHFSGHGGSEGLVLVNRNGTQAIDVGTGPLGRLFGMFPGDIRVVLLSACFSRPQAEAIADAIGCAIGTHGEIPDDAAVTFNAAFYRAIASGYSVKSAYEQARLALQMEHSEQCECPELVVKKGVDADKIILVSHVRAVAWMSVALAGLAALAVALLTGGQPLPLGLQLGDCTSAEPTRARDVASAPAAASVTIDDEVGPAADLARAKALCQLGHYDEAFPLFKSAAEAGIPEAIGFLGIAYQSGEGVEADSQRAIELLRKAGGEDDPRAMIALGIAYRSGFQGGFAVERQRRWARHWFEKAAVKAGSVEGMINLGRLYLEEHKDSLALAWFQTAVDSGSAEGIVEIGSMHEHGQGGPKNPALALELYTQAADSGSSRGMFEVGRMHQNGIGVPKNYAQARTWYLQGACEGSADAMYHLGLLYLDGLGVQPSRREGMRWIRLAAEAGYVVADKKLAQLEEEEGNGIGNVFNLAAITGGNSPAGCTVSNAVAAGGGGAMGSLAAR